MITKGTIQGLLDGARGFAMLALVALNAGYLLVSGAKQQASALLGNWTSGTGICPGSCVVYVSAKHPTVTCTVTAPAPTYGRCYGCWGYCSESDKCAGTRPAVMPGGSPKAWACEQGC